ncbi:hypothetical protein SPRG_06536 [Saprolegnia parasitica CBS 223.65]|uniref:Uncharacterized protein n=1 Tax=Saprolegnia parasitica (strain CBS 223.65) TaxID=695850 RepID=A0A067CPH9_SAPPC|nr:hypothetical protein SPRG_06536 [Saprolegnia parasitica CBS 223.65]KDO28682.1 hypothetical protein SPRG_06536 [Saprolegnia parasitica CBS 223.65]|eukprot:XP_012200741.1 hypothetical protein SPRG_06536 [Saprolegnia parasitica CBS 223.65]
MPTDRFHKFLEARQLVLHSASCVGVLASPHLSLRAYKARNAAPSLWKSMSRAATGATVDRFRSILGASDGDDMCAASLLDARLDVPIAIHADAPDVAESYTRATRGLKPVAFPPMTDALPHALAHRRAYDEHIEALRCEIDAAAGFHEIADRPVV